jgi:mono/diheme cytochrome c family protein
VKSKKELNGKVDIMKIKMSSLVGLFIVFILTTSWQTALAMDEMVAKQLIQEQCSTCHKFKGQPESRFNLKAPDLMWGGSKFKRDWLVAWLQGKEASMYSKSYRWDLLMTPVKHPSITEEQANRVADYFEKNLKDPTVKPNTIDYSKFSEMEYNFGAKIFREFSCIGCHQVKEDGQTTGGPQSADFFEAAKRYNPDWIYRFNSNPPDFVPHSGEYVADVSGLGLRYVTGYIALQGAKDFKFFEPWKTKYFSNVDAAKGANVYKEYCSQCHGANGDGDGPAASGLNPKPAVHSKMALSDFPDDYLFNLIYYGGKSVGKSSLMPDFGLTLPPQDLANVVAYLKETFKERGETSSAISAGSTQTAKANGAGCLQKRTTKKASATYLKRKNPLSGTEADIQAGEKIFMKEAKPVACQMCHGKTGNGKGPGAGGMNPRPRDFSCTAMMKNIPDGQLFWVIKNGSSGTGMMAFKKLKDKQIWQLITYIRTLAK